MIDSTYEDKLYQTPTFAGAVRKLQTNEFRNTVMLRLLRVNRLCSRTVSGTANRLKKHGRRNPLPFPFSQRSHVGNLRQTIQGKGVILKRVETAGVYPLVRPRGVSALPAEVQRKTPRPSGANTLTQFVCPGQPVLKKSAARQERTRLRQFERPAGSVQRKVPPGQGEHANAVRVPRSAGAEKAAAPFGRTACAVRVSRLTLRSYLTILREQSMLSQQQNRRKYEPVHPCTLRSVPRH